MRPLKMPKDIDDVKTNLIGPFSGRQLLGLGLAAAAFWVCLQYLRQYLPSDICICVCMIVAVPALAFGFLPPSMLQGMHAEQYAWVILYYNILRPVNRKYKTKNAWDGIHATFVQRERTKRKLLIKSRTRAERKKAKAFNASLQGVR